MLAVLLKCNLNLFYFRYSLGTNVMAFDLIFVGGFICSVSQFFSDDMVLVERKVF